MSYRRLQISSTTLAEREDISEQVKRERDVSHAKRRIDAVVRAVTARRDGASPRRWRRLWAREPSHLLHRRRRGGLLQRARARLAAGTLGDGVLVPACDREGVRRKRAQPRAPHYRSGDEVPPPSARGRGGGRRRVTSRRGGQRGRGSQCCTLHRAVLAPTTDMHYGGEEFGPTTRCRPAPLRAGTARTERSCWLRTARAGHSLPAARGLPQCRCRASNAAAASPAR